MVHSLHACLIRRTLLALAIVLPYSGARLRPAEHDALWQLYEATQGASWTNNDGWDRATDPCRKTRTRTINYFDSHATEARSGTRYNATPWFGVGCLDPCDDYLDGFHCTAGRVSSLLLGSNNLNGDIAGWLSVGQLRNLTHVELNNNALSGGLPTQIGLIRNLNVIRLENNELSGDLPSELASLNTDPRGEGELSEVSLANNQLHGVLPASFGPRLDTLRMLDASNNSISGTLPEAYGQMPSLQVLHLHLNGLSGTLPASLGIGGTAIRSLDLNSNPALSGTLPTSIGQMESLQRLLLDSTALSGTLPTTLGMLTNLNILKLNDNQLSGSLPTELGRFGALEELDLYGNVFAGDVPSQIGRLTNLRLLFLPNEQLLPLRLRYCQQRMPNVGKYSYRIMREEYQRMMTSICPEPYDTLNAFGTLAQISGGDDV